MTVRWRHASGADCLSLPLPVKASVAATKVNRISVETKTSEQQPTNTSRRREEEEEVIFSDKCLLEKVFRFSRIWPFTNAEQVQATKWRNFFEMNFEKLIVFSWIFPAALVFSFNLEPRLSILKQGPANTYFGFSVSQHQVVYQLETCKLRLQQLR